ncbi:hypothetical protein L1987_33107 [Smallanthus sonchifolius]|uniref:Uncharacterized protein n=1 Tax=Smallanthus sonchifolius TaxID=185202 RepID=A0ACB9HPF4_9ASTR|nr:hypothetical protein L1987_33107 [Smallanthus sonchifolius]
MMNVRISAVIDEIAECPSATENDPFDCTRSRNPTRDVLERFVRLYAQGHKWFQRWVAQSEDGRLGSQRATLVAADFDLINSFAPTLAGIMVICISDDLALKETRGTPILADFINVNLQLQAATQHDGTIPQRVGEKSATVIGATFQWFLRDLNGMLGGVMFTFYQGSNLDSNAKMWYLVTDLMNDLGMLMDLVSPLFPPAFVFIVRMGSLSRSFRRKSGDGCNNVRNGFRNASCAHYNGTPNNHIIPHVWCLNLTTLNCERSSILLLHFIETGQVFPPKEVSVLEQVLPLWVRTEELREWSECISLITYVNAMAAVTSGSGPRKGMVISLCAPLGIVLNVSAVKTVILFAWNN